MRLLTNIAAWLLTELAITIAPPPKPTLIDRQHAIKLADDTNNALGGFPRPIYTATEREATWLIRVQEKGNYAFGYHRLIYIDKRTGMNYGVEGK